MKKLKIVLFVLTTFFGLSEISNAQNKPVATSKLPQNQKVVKPLQKGRMTSSFWTHRKRGSAGNDYNVGTGYDDYKTPIQSVCSGVVVDKNTKPARTGGHSNGNYISVKCLIGSGVYEHKYLHMFEPSKIPVGSMVSAGQVLGKVGRSGTKVPHLHLSVFDLNGKRRKQIDPQRILARAVPSPLVKQGPPPGGKYVMAAETKTYKPNTNSKTKTIAKVQPQIMAKSGRIPASQNLGFTKPSKSAQSNLPVNSESEYFKQMRDYMKAVRSLER